MLYLSPPLGLRGLLYGDLYLYLVTFTVYIFMLVPKDDHEKAETWDMFWTKNILSAKI
jgi:hypothetical protein